MRRKRGNRRIQREIECFALFLIFLAGWLGTAQAAPQVGAQAYALLEASTGRVLLEHNADAELPMASTTKIMTCIVAMEEGDLDAVVEKLKSGAAMEEITKDMKYYAYYREAYGAVLDGMVGYFEQESGNNKVWLRKYGLKVFSPIAKNFPYSDFDDFGASRSYGFKRKHLGHDMMGQVGTPVIAVESGYVEALGWNQYGGWRIGIRSFDKKRYYYYAHLRQNYPDQSDLKEGSIVTAGDVIGYLGRTGYSTTENTNNITTPHLHFGLQLIFDESQKEGNNEIWINCYELVKFLRLNQSETVKVEGTKEWTRVYGMKDPGIPGEGERQETLTQSESGGSFADEGQKNEIRE